MLLKSQVYYIKFKLINYFGLRLFADIFESFWIKIDIFYQCWKIGLLSLNFCHRNFWWQICHHFITEIRWQTNLSLKNHQIKTVRKSITLFLKIWWLNIYHKVDTVFQWQNETHHNFSIKILVSSFYKFVTDFSPNVLVTELTSFFGIKNQRHQNIAIKICLSSFNFTILSLICHLIFQC